MKTYRIMVNICGFVDVEAESEEDAIEHAKKMDESEFSWGETRDYSVVGEYHDFTT